MKGKLIKILISFQKSYGLAGKYTYIIFYNMI